MCVYSSDLYVARRDAGRGERVVNGDRELVRFAEVNVFARHLVVKRSRVKGALQLLNKRHR